MGFSRCQGQWRRKISCRVGNSLLRGSMVGIAIVWVIGFRIVGSIASLLAAEQSGLNAAMLIYDKKNQVNSKRSGGFSHSMRILTTPKGLLSWGGIWS